MKAVVSAALFAAFFAGPTLAGGVAEPIPEAVILPAPIVQDWTGFYLGGQIGYVDADLSNDDFVALFGVPVLNASGGLFGVHAGYMHDFGTLVLGVEADYDHIDLDFRAGAIGANEFTAATLDWIARLKLRVGVDLGNTLLYATGGVAWAQVDTPDEGAFSDSGVFYGVGAALRVSEDWFVSAELLQHEFDEFDTPTASLDATTFTLRASFQF